MVRMGLAPDPFSRFSINLDDAGRGEVVIDGVDVTEKVGALRFECSSKGPLLTLFGAATGEIQGVGVVHTVADGDGRTYCENFLRQIDADSIDRRLLSDSVDEPFNTARIIEELLRVLSGG
jgi:hypothetical protein